VVVVIYLFICSHLPEKLVAAFVKRLARLALIAPTNDVIVICQFIGNLILRHPGLKCLIDSEKVDEGNEIYPRL
jgi:U3 small nucleolar RNA-associated protein 19